VAAHAHFRVAELAHLPALHGAAQLRGHGLHAVADAQHGNPQLEDGPGGARGLLLGDGRVAPGEHHAAGIERAHEIVAHVVRVQLAVHPRLANAPRDELRDLGPEVEDEDLVSRRGNSALPS
jgi:hypothetical protein